MNQIETRFTAETGIVFGKIEGFNATENKYISCWGHFDTSDGRMVRVGPCYPTKEQLLADHEAYLKRAGWLA